MFTYDEIMSQNDTKELTLAAYKMQEVYRNPKNTMDDAIHKVQEDFPNLKRSQLEGMWKAINTYVYMNVM